MVIEPDWWETEVVWESVADPFYTDRVVIKHKYIIIKSIANPCSVRIGSVIIDFPSECRFGKQRQIPDPDEVPENGD